MNTRYLTDVKILYLIYFPFRKEKVMTKKLELYKCLKCGNLVEVVLAGDGELLCCNEPMELLQANTTDASDEKHVPVFEHHDDELYVRIGAEPHPMTDEHYIPFIEVISDDEVYIKRKYLKPDEEPLLKLKGYDKGKLTSKSYCNIHGLWESKHD